MRILIVTQYYPPEVGAAQNRLFHLATCLKDIGHSITVLTGLPNYPIGRIYEGYKGRLLMEEHSSGIRIVRSWLYTNQTSQFAGRVMSYLSFSGLALLLSMFKVNRQDIVIAESPPLFVGIAGLIISKMKMAKFVLNVSDLWPDSAVELGMLTNGLLIWSAQCVEKLLYRKAHLITGQTQGIVNKILSCATSKPVVLMTNGVDGERFGETEELSPNEIRKATGFSGRFVVGYAGLHGLMQDLETVIEAASLLRAYEDVFFVFYGDGPKKDKLIRLAREARIQNIRFYPPEAVNRMPEIFSSFDVMVIPFRRLAILKGAIPSKMLEAMAAAIPIVLSGEGEAKNLIQDAECGIVVEPENPNLLAQGVLELYHSDSYRRRLGRSGRSYVLQHYDRRRINRNFAALLSHLHYGERISSRNVAHGGHRSSPMDDKTYDA